MTEATLTPTKTIDERGKICPYPDVDTMTTLKKMKKGEILEILIDYPLSVERIPRSAEKNGHKVLSVKQVDGPNHSIIIEVLGNK